MKSALITKAEMLARLTNHGALFTHATAEKEGKKIAVKSSDNSLLRDARGTDPTNLATEVNKVGGKIL